MRSCLTTGCMDAGADPGEGGPGGLAPSFIISIVKKNETRKS